MIMNQMQRILLSAPRSYPPPPPPPLRDRRFVCSIVLFASKRSKLSEKSTNTSSLRNMNLPNSPPPGSNDSL
ncbi:unnamed protein product, partial [Brassica rapa subsp. narinosa]